MLEQIIESLINNGHVSREEINRRIEEYKKTNPAPQDIQNLGRAVVMSLINDDNLSFMMMDILFRLSAAENKIAELEALHNA